QVVGVDLRHFGAEHVDRPHEVEEEEEDGDASDGGERSSAAELAEVQPDEERSGETDEGGEGSAVTGGSPWHVSASQRLEGDGHDDDEQDQRDERHDHVQYRSELPNRHPPAEVLESRYRDHRHDRNDGEQQSPDEGNTPLEESGPEPPDALFGHVEQEVEHTL